MQRVVCCAVAELWLPGMFGWWLWGVCKLCIATYGNPVALADQAHLLAPCLPACLLPPLSSSPSQMAAWSSWARAPTVWCIWP